MDVNFGVQAAQESNWIDPSGIWGFVGTLFGAVVGGVISWVLQRQAFKDQTARQQQHDMDHDRQLATAMCLKAFDMLNQLAMIEKHVVSELKKMPTPDAPHPWRFVLPLANVLHPVNFSADELSLLLRLKENDLLNRAALSCRAHNTQLSAIQTYSTQRMNMSADMPSTVTGNHGVAIFTHRQMQKFGPRWAELNSLIIYVRDGVTKDRKDMDTLLLDLAKAMNERIQCPFAVLAPTPHHPDLPTKVDVNFTIKRQK